MSDDLVLELRLVGRTFMPELMHGSANEIERLRAEIAELRARAERAEGRIADAKTAVIAKMPGSAFGVFVLAPELVGKRVALVVVND